MKPSQPIEHEFVEFIPGQLAPNSLYVSIEYATCMHLCACGCGERVVTPLSPTDWSLIYDGTAVSLTPSIGNWNFDCRSHYWIKDGRVVWSSPWSRERIDANRAHARCAKQRYYAQPAEDATETAGTAIGDSRPIWLRRLFRRRRR